AIAPPPGHPLRRAMEILEEIYRTADAMRRQTLFKSIQDAQSEEVWHISIATPPPQLVVVKEGLRNVPEVALYGNSFNTPGNTGMETFAWEQSNDLPATVADVSRAMVEIVTDPAMSRIVAEPNDSESLVQVA